MVKTGLPSAIEIGQKAYDHLWYMKNRERIKKKMNKRKLLWIKENPELNRKYHREYYHRVKKLKLMLKRRSDEMKLQIVGHNSIAFQSEINNEQFKKIVDIAVSRQAVQPVRKPVSRKRRGWKLTERNGIPVRRIPIAKFLKNKIKHTAMKRMRFLDIMTQMGLSSKSGGNYIAIRQACKKLKLKYGKHGRHLTVYLR